MGKMHANMENDRAGGTSSSDASGKPPAIYFMDPSYRSVIESFINEGFFDAETGETGFLIERVSRYHLDPYLKIAKICAGSNSPSIKTAYDLLVFDRRCQSLVLEYIGVLETQLRAQYGHWMELEDGAYAVYNEDLFIDSEKYKESHDHLEGEVQSRADKSKALEAMMVDGKIPTHIAVECITFGTLSQLYANTKRSDYLDNVARSFRQPKRVLVNWIKTINAARNCFAHFNCYFFKKQIPSSPMKVLESEMSRKSPMYLVIILEKLLSSPLIFKDPLLHYSTRLAMGMVQQIEELEKTIPEAIPCLGLDSNWRKDLVCEDVVDASILTVLVNEESKKLSLGRMSDEPDASYGFDRKGVVIYPKRSTET